MWLNNILQVMTIVITTKLVQASLTKTCNVTYEFLTAAETDQLSVQCDKTATTVPTAAAAAATAAATTMINFVKQFSLFNFSTMESQPAMV
jgi:hypothetical protein